jgi:hypothetical protein
MSYSTVQEFKLDPDADGHTAIPMPQRLRVGPFDYTVQSWPSREASAAERFGECDRFNNVIRVRDDISEQRSAETMIHEILHAVWDTQGLGDNDAEERIVTCLALGLSQVIRDNPDFVAWMQQNLEG